MIRQDIRLSKHDIVICGGGVAGLWLLNVLVNTGFDAILIERDKLGGTQTMASQGMIHGGQRYMLGPISSSHAESVAPLPERWDACLRGQGELDLREVRVLSDTQVMWPTSGRLSQFALNTATHMLKAKVRKLQAREVPDALSGVSGFTVYELPEKVLDIRSLVEVLAKPHKKRIYQGNIESMAINGQLTVSGLNVNAQLVICAAGLGNEEFLSFLGADKTNAQRRPLRQFLVKSMPYPLYGHGITTSYKPRVTITSYPLQTGGHVWYLGGAIADDTLNLSEEDAISYAKKEMQALFAQHDWSAKQWATWYCVRAEASTQNGRLPNGPVVQQYGDTLVVWPTKLTLTPLLGDQVISHLTKNRVFPKNQCITQLHAQLAQPGTECFPWDQVEWK